MRLVAPAVETVRELAISRNQRNCKRLQTTGNGVNLFCYRMDLQFPTHMKPCIYEHEAPKGLAKCSVQCCAAEGGPTGLPFIAESI
jgi:hypothetical protein